MKALVLFLIIADVCSNDIPVKRYKVNLDLHPTVRWNDVLGKHKDYVNILNSIFNSIIPKEFLPLLEKLAGNLDEYIPQPFADEIKGIANYLGVPIGQILIANIVYDVTAFNHPKIRDKFCTSIVAQSDSGDIIHGRNLDYPIITGALQNVTAEIDFIKNGKVLYTSTQYIGTVGIWTAQKPGLFTVSIDERDQGFLWENLFVAIFERSSLVSLLTRQVLEEATSYEEALARLSRTPIVAPVYYIVGGLNAGEGAVITRDRMEAADVWNLDKNNGRWYVLETNYDHWKPTPKDDNRRFFANQAMNKTGSSNINFETMFKALSTQKVLNNITTYTTVMSAKYPERYSSWLRQHDP